MYQMIVVDDEAELREGISNYFPWESLNIRVTGIFENGLCLSEGPSGGHRANRHPHAVYRRSGAD